MKTSIIEKCKFTSEYKHPVGGNILYYHELTMNNGDIGSVGCDEKYPDKIKEDMELSYTIEPAKKPGTFKIVIIDAEAEKNAAKQTANGYKSPQDMLGFCFAYAKDLAIAKLQHTVVSDGLDIVDYTVKAAEALYVAMKDIKNRVG